MEKYQKNLERSRIWWLKKIQTHILHDNWDRKDTKKRKSDARIFILTLFYLSFSAVTVFLKWPFKQFFFWISDFPTPLEGSIPHVGPPFLSYNENVLVLNGIRMSLLVWEASLTKSHRGQTSKWNTEALQSSKISIKFNSKAWGSACELLYKLWMTEPSRHITHTRKLGGWSDR